MPGLPGRCKESKLGIGASAPLSQREFHAALSKLNGGCLRSTLNEDTQAFSLTTHIKAIERWMKADDQRMQQAIQDLNSMMKQLRWPPLPGPSCDTLPC